METLIRRLMFFLFNAVAVLDIGNAAKAFKKDRYYMGGLYTAIALVLIYVSVYMIVITQQKGLIFV